MKTPCVYLVGAGPGDPSLISVRGQRLLQAADVVVHDHRVQKRLLRLARPDAERIDVGPTAPKPLEQEAICYLLAEKAREGKSVVRLKWGDPFVFGGAGKEALFLHEQHIPFEIVPGIPPGIGGPAYAGVPVTYPGAGDVLTFVRGLEGESDTPPDIDWTKLTATGATLVCYAGARQVRSITGSLASHGRAADESAVFISDVTLPSQHTIQGTLGDIASEVPDGASGLLVVGAVAGLRQHLRWFDERPLFGRRIVV
ncbi:MAG TPA: uroporphyrinogen-III C-methyltransferase, partial [Vicinamibacterales bacterium]|nr:uroporphyrinogen-III C-methyltransferase [Vicinamibacterales bacterium]